MPIQQSEYPGIQRNGKVGECAKKAIEEWEQLGEKLASLLTAAPHGDDNFGATPPRFDQFRNHLGRILEVTVHDDRGIATGSLKARGDSSHMSPVTRQLDDHYMRIRSLQAPQ